MKTNSLYLTVRDIIQISNKYSIPVLFTRYCGSFFVDDIDLFVSKVNFQRFIDASLRNGYKQFSHDHALGGRIAGAQMNLIKSRRIKIDLHNDFTWRKSRYFDTDILMTDKRTLRFGSVQIFAPELIKDTFIVIVNIIFEKTYMKNDDNKVIEAQFESIINDPWCNEQAKKYGWIRTWNMFKKWYQHDHDISFPHFIPLTLVLYSYWEKSINDRHIDIRSLIYYLFFRTRFFINKTLPYD